VSHVTHMSESCHTYEWVMSHIWVSHVTHMSESCHTYEWVMSLHCYTIPLTASTVTHLLANESCHTYEWVMSHVTHLFANESCHTYERIMSHVTHLFALQHRLSRMVWQYSLFYRALLHKRPIIWRGLRLSRMVCYGMATISRLL